MKAPRVDSAAVENLESQPRRATSSAAPPEVSDARYEVLRKLGEGGAGAVYLVRDRETQELLALKRLLRMDTTSVSRLKREFRSIADLHHPNLIKLYDLGRAEDGWFITMEYLEGTDVLSYCDGGGQTLLRSLPANQNAGDGDGSRVARVCGAFQQLASGIRALHRAGMLHRDLKPSNVMVAQQRVIVLDLGLVRELGELAVTVTNEDVVAGTPAYMAPEQVHGHELSQATDWYALGVMLYEALSGCLPIEGRLIELLRKKVESDPAPLDELVPELPATLSSLCMGLLQRDPTARPSYDEIASVLARHAETDPTTELIELEPAPHEQTQTRSLSEALFGRTEELRALWDTFADVQRGSFVVAHVRGVSGAGKSALITHFLDRLERQASQTDGQAVVVLRGRCYEREAMPFKALDGSIDALVQHLERQTDLVVGHVLPAQLDDLVRAFPAFERLNAVRHLIERNALRANAALVRTRAELALRELLRRFAARQPLVLWIDDLQWGDLDSASILRSWLEEPEGLPLLLILSYRSDELAENPCLQFLAEREVSPLVIEHQIDLAPLHAEDVEALCQQRLGDLPRLHAPLVARIVEEARGSPFFASQLLTLAEARLAQGESDLHALSVEGVVSQASVLLPPAARRLLQVLAVAGRPMALRIAFKAAGIRRDGRALLHALRSLRLTRMRVVDRQQLLETYHDRVREAVLAALSASEREQTHRSLLEALEASGKADPDWLHELSLGAGEIAAGLRYGLQAAERAEAKMAFERAAELYRRCLDLGADTRSEHGTELWLKLALALGNARRGLDAAQAYLEAAKHEPAERSIELIRLAATHLLRSGRYEQGEALIDQVLAALDIDVPRSKAGLYAAIGWERGRLALRGLRFTPRELADLDPKRVAEAYTYGSLSIDMQSFDPLRAALFQSRCMRLVLDLGYAPGVADALCAEALMACVSGSAKDGKRAEAMLDRAEQLVGRGDLGRARILSARAVTSWLLGLPSATVEYATQAERVYRSLESAEGTMAGEYYHRFAVAAVRIGALFQLAELREATAALRSEQQEARATDNRTADLHLTLVATIADTVEGTPELGRQRVIRERSELPKNGFGPLHVLHLVSVMWLGCATGEYAWAKAICDEDWPRYQRSVVRRSAFLASLAHGWHARLLLAQQVMEPTHARPAPLLRHDLRELAKRPDHLALSMRNMLNARLSLLAGEREQAIVLVRAQIAFCMRVNARMDTLIARFALGCMLGGSEGQQLCLEAEESMRELGVARPLAMMTAHFPELVRLLQSTRSTPASSSG